MLENWVWQPDALHRMSAHYEDGSPIPDDLMHALVKSRVANAGTFNMRQIALATFDQRIHKMAEVMLCFLHSPLLLLCPSAKCAEIRMTCSHGTLLIGSSSEKQKQGKLSAWTDSQTLYLSG